MPANILMMSQSSAATVKLNKGKVSSKKNYFREDALSYTTLPRTLPFYLTLTTLFSVPVPHASQGNSARSRLWGAYADLWCN
jgi:hypothetical protein